VVRDHEQRHLADRRGDGVGLLHHVQAVPVVLDHLPQAPHLPLDPADSGCFSSAVRRKWRHPVNSTSMYAIYPAEYR
jgi:hypothetical protein